MTDTKTCERPGCGQEFTRRKGVSQATFTARKYCSNACSTQARHDTAVEEHRAYIAAETRHLLGTDSAANIATRLGYSHPRHLARMLGRWGEHELAARIDRETRAEAA